jgi:hypothetical protein
MAINFAGLKLSDKSSDHPLVTKVGHFAYWSALVVIFTWAAWLRFRLPLDPIAVPAYVMPALRKLIGAEFGDIHLGRTIIYPGFVYLLLRVFGDFRAITVFHDRFPISSCHLSVCSGKLPSMEAEIVCTLESNSS